MTKRLFNLILLAVVTFCSLTSCASEEPKRKKVVGPDGSQYSNLPWNRPRSWEGNARNPLGAMGGMGSR
ncbi:hypothetical protein [Prosthecobacter sp.]|uniref:hypothetical protein n=1 Tax=Prosthecobacter sp. TaxID=1965333 RepID=UPI002ABC613E|nr:hypothetical protein [Prosthecobacter sp.]MDZ4404466.1 hypothetical protein [Prosthecobacter sp.]